MRETNRNLPIAATLVVVGTLLAGFPVRTAAQEGPGVDCWKCGWSDVKAWPSLKCYKSAKGSAADCTTTGGPTTECQKSGGACTPTMADAATDQQAIEMVRKGQVLPPDGDYFFVSEAEATLILRKCDLSLVATIPAWAVEPAGDGVAIVGGERYVGGGAGE